MSPAMSALASIGVTHQVLILAVLGLVAAGVIGIYWHYIMPGAIIILVASLFYVAPDGNSVNIEAVKDEQKHEVFDEYAAYIKDCTEVAEYSLQECKKLWKQRGEDTPDSEVQTEAQTKVPEQPVSEVRLLDVDNQEYKVRRAAALKKPNAVVMRETYR